GIRDDLVTGIQTCALPISSRRFKEEINPMDKASEVILGLQPVSFRYKKEIEPNGAIMFGLIAEDVEKVDPDLVTRNDKGEPETRSEERRVGKESERTDGT